MLKAVDYMIKKKKIARNRCVSRTHHLYFYIRDESMQDLSSLNFVPFKSRNSYKKILSLKTSEKLKCVYKFTILDC